jgi:hypothetical protein
MIKTKNELFVTLGYSSSEIDEILSNIDKYYYSYKKIKKNKLGEIQYKDGKIQKRKITPSKKDLKDVQNRIQQRILSKI